MARRALRVGVVIAAGGSGRRLGGKTPKQFLRLHDKTILEHSLSRFHSVSTIREIIVVAPPAFLQKTIRVCKAGGFAKISSVVAGGRERQHSVWNGLMAFRNIPDIVLVHDAVRPFVSRKMILQVMKDAHKYGAAVVGVPVKDTIKVEKASGFYSTTLDRSRLWAVQTPQGFSFDVLVKAHRAARRAGFLGTDEASLVERCRIPVRIVRGDYRNTKITTADDLKLARSSQ